MGIVERMKSWIGWRSLENPAVPMSEGIDMLFDAFGGGPNPSGQAVNARTAMRLTAVYACVRVIAETAGSLPIGVVKKISARQTEPDPTHPRGNLLVSPNTLQTGQVFREQAFKAHLLNGVTYAEIVSNPEDGGYHELWPLEPSRTQLYLDGRRLWYETSSDSGRARTLQPSEVLHIPLFPDITTGVGNAPPAAGRTAIGLALGAEEQAAKLFRGGALPPMTVELAAKLDDDNFNRLRKEFENARRGGRGVIMLEKGMKGETLKQELAVFLDMRRFQVLEVARIFGVPAIMIGEAEKGAPKSSVEAQEREFASHTLKPLLRRFEAEYDRKLFARGERRAIRHDLSELVRADTKVTWDTYIKGLTNAVYSINDVLEDLGRPGIGPAGDRRVSPVNLAPIPRAVERLDADFRWITNRLATEERRRLLGMVSDFGADGMAERAKPFYHERCRNRIVPALIEAGERFANSMKQPADLPGFRQFVQGVADAHRGRAIAALEADPLAWIAAAGIEYDASRALSALLKGNNNGGFAESKGGAVGAGAN